MNVDELNAKYDEVYKKNAEIQKLLSEVEDYNEILFYLYDTEIRRPNLILNTMIGTYESLILKLREAHKEMITSLNEFGEEKELTDSISNNDELPEKAKELALWKLRRLFMVYDEEALLPYLEGDLANLELIVATKQEIAAQPDVEEAKKENNQVSPNGGLFENNPDSFVRN